MAVPNQPLEYHSPDAVRPRSWLACNWWKVLSVIAAAIGIVAIVVISFIVRYVTVLNRNLALAKQHIALISPAMTADPRFVDIEMSDFPAGQGCIIVQGTADSPETLKELQSKIVATSPPVYVQWSVEIVKPKQTAGLHK